MTGVRLSTRTDLKNDIVGLYNNIHENNVRDALESLGSVKKNTIMYYNTRGIDCSHLFPIFAETRNLLQKNFLLNPDKSEMCKQKLFDYIFKLNKALKFSVVDGLIVSDARQDPISLLKEISDDLVDDYSEFNIAGGQELVQKNRNVLDLVKNDLLEIRELEQSIRKKAPQFITEYNALVKHANLCLMILPQVKDVTVSSSTAKTFRTYFEGLFNSFADILVPVDVQKPSEKRDEITMKKAEPEIKQEQKQETKKEPKAIERSEEQVKEQQTEPEEEIDYEELERRAKEGTLND
jgi:hypothetical protein